MRQAQTLHLGLNSAKVLHKRSLRLFEYKDFPVALRRLNSQGGRPINLPAPRGGVLPASHHSVLRTTVQIDAASGGE